MLQNTLSKNTNLEKIDNNPGLKYRFYEEKLSSATGSNFRSKKDPASSEYNKILDIIKKLEESKEWDFGDREKRIELATDLLRLIEDNRDDCPASIQSTMALKNIENAKLDENI